MKVILDEPVTLFGVTWGRGEYETEGLQEPWKSALEGLAEAGNSPAPAEDVTPEEGADDVPSRARRRKADSADSG